MAVAMARRLTNERDMHSPASQPGGIVTTPRRRPSFPGIDTSLAPTDPSTRRMSLPSPIATGGPTGRISTSYATAATHNGGAHGAPAAAAGIASPSKNGVGSSQPAPSPAGSAGHHNLDMQSECASVMCAQAADLCAAAAEGDALTLAALIEMGHPVNGGDYDKRTAIHLASEEGYLDCVQLLVESGADVNCRDRWGTTPLKGAVHNIHNEVANYLRDHGAKVTDDTADMSQYAQRKGEIRRWFNRVLTYCGLLSESMTVPAVGFASFLVAEHGIDITKHKAVAREVAGVCSKWSRSHADVLPGQQLTPQEQQLQRWMEARDQWEPLVTPLPPLRKASVSAASAAPVPHAVPLRPRNNSGDSGGADAGSDSSSSSPPASPFAAHLEAGGAPRNMSGRAQLKRLAGCGSAAASGCDCDGIPPHLLAGLHHAVGGRTVGFNDMVEAVLGADPRAEDGAGGSFKRNPARQGRRRAKKGLTAPLLQHVILGKLQINNWRAFVEMVIDIAAEVLEGPNDGKNADYIPDLKEDKVDPDLFSVCICTVDGQQLTLGDHVPFCVQSCGKAFVYAQCVEEYGHDEVHRYVGQEPSGRAFNDFALTPAGKPFNAVTNAGAIMTVSLFHPEETSQDRTIRWLGKMQKFAGGEPCDIDQSMYQSEKNTAYRNHAIANFMMAETCFPKNVNNLPELERHIDFYLRTCAVRVSGTALSNAAATLANYGECPLTAEKVLSFQTVKATLQLAYTCGMYNFSGEWACTVGIPAKSGVSGAIWLAVPGVLGLCVRSPRLDAIGNSVRAVRFSKRFAERFQWSVMDLVYRARDNGRSAG